MPGRVVLVVPSFPKLSESFIVSKFLGLLDRGWDVQVVCGISDAGEWARFPEMAGRPGLRQRVHPAWPHRPRWLAASLIPAALARCLAGDPVGTVRYLHRGRQRFGPAILRRCYLDAGLIAAKPDLIHFEFGALAVGRTYVKDLLDCPMVVSFRGYDLNYAGLEDPDYYSEVWRCADALHLLGEDLWRRAQRRGCPPHKAHLLTPPAIDAARFDPGDRCHTEVAGTLQRPLRILSVGRLEWKKGYDHALKAVRLLMDRQIHCQYRVIGDGVYLEAVAFARHQMGLENVVHLLGAQPRDEVRAAMGWADLLLHPAVSEGFGNAVMEAQAMALPVVCTDADGLRENVADGESGFVVPRRDPEALAQRMARLAGDPGLRQRMGLAGRRRVVTLFRPQDQIDAFDRLYRHLLAPGGVAQQEPRSEGLLAVAPRRADRS